MSTFRVLYNLEVEHVDKPPYWCIICSVLTTVSHIPYIYLCVCIRCWVQSWCPHRMMKWPKPAASLSVRTSSEQEASGNQCLFLPSAHEVRFTAATNPEYPGEFWQHCVSSVVWWWMWCREILSRQRWTMRPDKESIPSAFSWPGSEYTPPHTHKRIQQCGFALNWVTLAGFSWLVRACQHLWMMTSSGMATLYLLDHFVTLDERADSCLSVELQRSRPTGRCPCLRGLQ